ncbi:Mediator of RNA polymerase II transcription subunit 10 [Smittium culicis]|uniref:Mediator of RNA polymerase II transcription subunit 10 n=1 Tax=Smittium culicis TaxID=133412 RepID=A0A1R1Y4K5_9FUNG|nr:Mediator of RNA polymerase II transcription subunit 10 [Smittium culicis]
MSSFPSQNGLKPDESSDRDKVEDLLLEITEALAEIGVTVYDYQPESELLLHERVDKLIKKFSLLNSLSKNLNLSIPAEILNCIEENINPELYNKDFLERTAAENQFLNGKSIAISKLSSSLRKSLSKSSSISL